jgi:hypothetical protein
MWSNEHYTHIRTHTIDGSDPVAGQKQTEARSEKQITRKSKSKQTNRAAKYSSRDRVKDKRAGGKREDTGRGEDDTDEDNDKDVEEDDDDDDDDEDEEKETCKDDDEEEDVGAEGDRARSRESVEWIGAAETHVAEASDMGVT